MKVLLYSKENVQQFFTNNCIRSYRKEQLYKMRHYFYSRVLSRQWNVYQGLNLPKRSPTAYKFFHASAKQLATKPFMLADIGEGENSCMIRCYSHTNTYFRNQRMRNHTMVR